MSGAAVSSCPSGDAWLSDDQRAPSEIGVAAVGSLSGPHPRSRGLHHRSVRFGQGNVPHPAIVGLPRRFGGRGGRALEAVPPFLTRLKQCKLHREARIRQKAAAACDGALFVSNPLQAVCAGLLEDKPAAVIPCAASEDIFFFDECLRACSRERLGYSADHRVFVFSGGMQPYQCVDLTVEIFRKLAAEDPAARLLMITPNAPTRSGPCSSAVKASFA